MGTLRDDTLMRPGLSEGEITLSLFLKYSLLSIYGLLAVAIEVPTFTIVGSKLFALVWASCVALLAIAAAIGVARTWFTGKFRLEMYATFAFISTFLGYSVALGYRAFNEHTWSSLPLAILPMAFCVLPAIRHFSLARKSGKASREGRRNRGEGS